MSAMLAVSSYFDQLADLLGRIDADQIEATERYLRAAIAEDRLIFFAGNGGSAATASHLVADFQKGLQLRGSRHPHPRALCLTDNVPLVTAWSNDEAYRVALARQLESLGRPGDVLITISSSGRSPNLLHAAQTADALNIHTLAWTGQIPINPVGHLASHALTIEVPTRDTQLAEDCHVAIGHALYRRLRDWLGGAA